MEKSKSRSLKVASRLIGYIGVGACLLGALAYLIMHKLEYQLWFGPFEWEHLYYVAAAAAVIIVIAAILRIASNVARKNELAEGEIYEAYDEAEEAYEEDADEVEVEIAEDVEPKAADETVEAVEVVENRSIVDIIREKTKLTPEQKAKIVATVKKNAPVIAAVAATAVVSATISKIASEKRKAKIRRNILDLLY